MYETQFGLAKRPFRALAAGGDVFVGPQTAAAMAGLKKALATPDAIVSVNGPVGVGKTTIVRRALEAIGKDQVIVTVGRMQLGHDEVLELLLEELGIEMPSGTVQRFSAFRRLLLKHAEEDTRVFVVVEDAKRIGADALSELEALTASDAGVSEGANIVLMGDSDVDAMLQSPQLARVRQRLRLRQSIVPLGASELLGYFKHCFRLAGNEFDAIFEGGSAEVLHRLSGGIPRVANNLVESSLISAVENKLDRVNVAQIKLVANEEYGLSINGEPAVDESAEPVPAPQPEPAPQPKVEVKPQPDIQPRPEPRPEPRPAPKIEMPPTPAEAAENDIPDLIQDTLPNLKVLAPNLAKPAPPEPSFEATQAEPPEEAVPEWERDPTLAQLRPDLDALEHAMAVAQGLDATEEAATAKAKADEDDEPVPEITLDREIQAKVEKAEEVLKEEEARRAEREAREREESGIDDRPTSVILAEARAKGVEEKQKPDNSVEAQIESASFMPPASENELPQIPTLDELHESTDTVTDLPVLKDMTNPAFEPAAYQEADGPAEESLPDIPELAFEPELQAEPEPVLQVEPEPAPIPELKLDDEALPELVFEPEPEPEPILEAEPEPEPEPEPKLQAEPEPEPEPEPEQLEIARKADAELEQIAANLSRAKTIDDCDDKMAETLFGEEFSMMAAQVAANAPPELSANDELSPTDELSSNDEDGDDEEIAVESATPDTPGFDGAAAISVELETKSNGMTAHMDTSASQRLATVRALNDGAPGIEAEPEPVPPPAELSAPVEQPQSIEDQINTSMTQTLEALSVRQPSEVVHDDDDDDDSRKGFFNRFKRS